MLVRSPLEADYKEEKGPVVSVTKMVGLGPTGTFNRKYEFTATVWKEVTLEYSWKVISSDANSHIFKLVSKAKFIFCFAK